MSSEWHRSSIQDLNKKYDEVHAVKDVNLEIRDKEFMVLVGPSGCGKTTTLAHGGRAGSDHLRRDLIGDVVVNDLAPMDRDIAMVFQNYALYPHMSVYDNMAFGLKMRKFAKRRDRQARAGGRRHPRHPELLKRKPRQLSGGQRQRVALGRAIVRHPQVFLFDEPLSNLDAKLRVQMRVELKKLHERLEHHGDLRHPRPGRGDDAGRSRGGDEGRPGAAGRRAARALQRAGQPLRRRLHRLAGDEFRRRSACTRSTARCIAESDGLRASRFRPRSAAAPPVCGPASVTMGIRPEDLQSANGSRSRRALLRRGGRAGGEAGLPKFCSTCASAGTPWWLRWSRPCAPSAVKSSAWRCTPSACTSSMRRRKKRSEDSVGIVSRHYVAAALRRQSA